MNPEVLWRGWNACCLPKGRASLVELRTLPKDWDELKARPNPSKKPGCVA